VPLQFRNPVPEFRPQLLLGYIIQTLKLLFVFNRPDQGEASSTSEEEAKGLPDSISGCSSLIVAIYIRERFLKVLVGRDLVVVLIFEPKGEISEYPHELREKWLQIRSILLIGGAVFSC